MKNIFLLLSLFFSISLLAQDRKEKPYILLRVHPVAYLATAYNMGVELRVSPTVHFTLAAFRQVYLGEPITQLLSTDDSKIKNVNGLTGRLGFKYMTEGDGAKHRNYLEL